MFTGDVRILQVLSSLRGSGVSIHFLSQIGNVPIVHFLKIREVPVVSLMTICKVPILVLLSVDDMPIFIFLMNGGEKIPFFPRAGNVPMLVCLRVGDVPGVAVDRCDGGSRRRSLSGAQVQADGALTGVQCNVLAREHLRVSGEDFLSGIRKTELGLKDHPCWRKATISLSEGVDNNEELPLPVLRLQLSSHYSKLFHSKSGPFLQQLQVTFGPMCNNEKRADLHSLDLSLPEFFNVFRSFSLARF